MPQAPGSYQGVPDTESPGGRTRPERSAIQWGGAVVAALSAFSCVIAAGLLLVPGKPNTKSSKLMDTTALVAAAPPAPLGSPLRGGLWCNRGISEASFRPPFPGMPNLWTADESSPAVQFKVLTYNLYWWSLFKGGGGQSASDLIAESGQDMPYDFMAFQECEDVRLVLSRAGLTQHYQVTQGEHNLCIATRSKLWLILDQGQTDVAEDTPKQYYGKRAAQWVRLRHSNSGKIVFFVNHHGPLGKNSGGICGGGATAYNLLKLIASHGRPGDAVVLVGDFNANAAAWTLEALFTRLRRSFFGIRGGDDNIFSNIRSTQKLNLGTGGSDHDALSIVFQVGEGNTLPPTPLETSASAASGSTLAPSPFAAPWQPQPGSNLQIVINNAQASIARAKQRLGLPR
mmetsp:Transcript_53197/g.105643  ORF Transcript_53197/g.105643 Transcript_53197/m.105643 type:complete len:400 (+) Transcript_53197:79-1278(+)